MLDYENKPSNYITDIINNKVNDKLIQNIDYFDQLNKISNDKIGSLIKNKEINIFIRYFIIISLIATSCLFLYSNYILGA